MVCTEAGHLSLIHILIRVSTPLIFAAMASLIARKGGVTNITIDSTMLMSALTGVLVSAYTQNLPLAVFCGILMGIVMGIFMGYFHILMNTNLILTEMCIRDSGSMCRPLQGGGRTD